jgi:hypothetical protein
MSYSTDAGGEGTLPMPNTPKWFLFVQAAVDTIVLSEGVWGWSIGNEYNNPREFPKDGSLTPEMVAITFNEIYNKLAEYEIEFRLTPGALDPFNAQAGDPRNWLTYIWDNILPPHFITAHGYIRGPHPELIGSEDKFNDAPLQWQYLNYPGCVTALLDYLPEQYKSLGVYITEFNHIWKDGGEGDWGWVHDDRAKKIVLDTYEVAKQAGLEGIALYRWAQDDWELHDNAIVKNTILEIGGV